MKKPYTIILICTLIALVSVDLYYTMHNHRTLIASKAKIDSEIERLENQVAVDSLRYIMLENNRKKDSIILQDIIRQTQH